MNTREKLINYIKTDIVKGRPISQEMIEAAVTAILVNQSAEGISRAITHILGIDTSGSNYWISVIQDIINGKK